MKTVRLTMAQALVKYLIAQRTIVDSEEVPLFAGVFGIFGHGNVTCLAEALEAVQDELPTWRGQNEQSMTLAAVAFTKAKRRRQIMVATSSIGPGAANMVTAAGVPAMIRSRRESSSCWNVGLMTKSSPTMPTRTPAMGMGNGSSLQYSDAPAPQMARTSLSLAWSEDRTMAMTWVSLR